MQTSQQRKFRDIRLFVIDTLDGEIVGTGNHIKTSKIKVVKEVTQKEVIEYFRKNEDRLPGKLKNDFNMYQKEKLDEYEIVLEEKIEKLIINSCMRYMQNSMCQQTIYVNELKACFGCDGYHLLGDTEDNIYDYYYLCCRKNILNGLDFKACIEFQKLKENDRIIEINNLILLENGIKINSAI